jgi:hypothetical protein
MQPRVNIDLQGVALGTAEHDNINHIAAQLNTLLAKAYEQGFIVTVENISLQPLAMRNARMLGEVRKAR